MMEIEKKWLRFVFVGQSKSGKTNVWLVSNMFTGCELGIIKWHGGWRQYCFYPLDGSWFGNNCLNEIIDFINERMTDRK